MSANAVLLLTGMTGSGKTSLLATAAEWVYKHHKLRSRLYTADGGGYGDKMEALIELGIVEVWRLRTRVGAGGEGLVEETCARASFGWWPEQVTKAGDSPSRCRLLPPMVTTWTMRCSEGHLLVQAQTQRGLQPTKCAACGKVVTLQSAKVTEESALAPHMAGLGAIFYEGLSSWSNWQLMSLADRRGRAELHGEKSNIGAFRSGEMEFDGNNRADYGFAQTAAEKWILNSTSIPGLVMPPVWTGLETRLEESGDRAAVWGPQIAGSARTGQVPQWVGDYLGAQIVKNDEGRAEHRLYLSRYVSEDGVPHPYKTRVSPGFLPEYLADAPGAGLFSSFSLGKYMELRAEARRQSVEAAKREFGEVPQRVEAVVAPALVPAIRAIAPPPEVRAEAAGGVPSAQAAVGMAGGPPIRRVPPPPPRRR